MKLLLFSDLHCDRDAAETIVTRAADADVVIGAGDFGSLRRNLDLTISILRTIQKPTIVVPGNNESFDELTAACHDWPAARVLHGAGTRIHDVDFYGIGGGIPVTPFGSWSYDFTEPQATELLADCPLHSVLVTHSPPRGAVDTSRGKNLGSSAVRSTIEQKQPRLVVCGHVHECAGRRATIDRSVVINAGPEGLLWTLE